MKKLLLVLSIASIFAITSCSKCATCTGSNTSYDGEEYCKGNSLEDLAYDIAKQSCEDNGGNFSK